MGMGMNLDLNNVPMRDSDIRTAIEEEKEEERKLSRVGGARFKTAINHCEWPDFDRLRRAESVAGSTRRGGAHMPPDLTDELASVTYVPAPFRRLRALLMALAAIDG
jgi:hypothetical protein